MSKKEAFKPDLVTSDCIFCFAVGSNGQLERFVSNYDSVISEIDTICKENSGRLFKTEAKTAKCAILLSPASRNKTDFDRYHNKGYITVLPEDFFAFFGHNDIYTPKKAKQDLSMYYRSF